VTVYRNARDTVRYVVHTRIDGSWDVDVWTGPTTMTTYSAEAGDAFRTRREARAWAENAAGGKLVPLSARTHPEVTSRWSNPAALRATWERISADEWELIVGDESVAELARDYPGRWGSVGKGWVKDRNKPMFWTLSRPGLPAARPCRAGTSVAKAKAAAEKLLGVSR
jgi:hypothetical protein